MIAILVLLGMIMVYPLFFGISFLRYRIVTSFILDADPFDIIEPALSRKKVILFACLSEAVGLMVIYLVIPLMLIDVSDKSEGFDDFVIRGSLLFHGHYFAIKTTGILCACLFFFLLVFTAFIRYSVKKRESFPVKKALLSSALMIPLFAPYHYLIPYSYFSQVLLILF